MIDARDKNGLHICIYQRDNTHSTNTPWDISESFPKCHVGYACPTLKTYRRPVQTVLAAYYNSANNPYNHLLV